MRGFFGFMPFQKGIPKPKKKYFSGSSGKVGGNQIICFFCSL